MLKSFQLAGSFSKLLINASEYAAPQRFFSLTSELNRNLDSRRVPKYMKPSRTSKRWIEPKPFSELYPKYTTDPLPFPSLGGRGPNGRIWNHKRGGGLKKVYLMIDHLRLNPKYVPEGKTTWTEKVYEIKKDKNRSGLIALVAGGEHKRYIMATENMKVGDIIVSSSEVTKTPVRPKEGNSYAIGSLPIGTVVSSVERLAGKAASVATSAGTFATLVRKEKNENGEELCFIKMPSKKEIIITKDCQATVGRVSNIHHHKEHYGKAGAKRWAGIRPRSGRWHRKDGRHGRKIRPIPAPMRAKEILSVVRDTYYTIPGNNPIFNRDRSF